MNGQHWNGMQVARRKGREASFPWNHANFRPLSNGSTRCLARSSVHYHRSWWERRSRSSRGVKRDHWVRCQASPQLHGGSRTGAIDIAVDGAYSLGHLRLRDCIGLWSILVAFRSFQTSVVHLLPEHYDFFRPLKGLEELPVSILRYARLGLISRSSGVVKRVYWPCNLVSPRLVGWTRSVPFQ